MFSPLFDINIYTTGTSKDTIISKPICPVTNSKLDGRKGSMAKRKHLATLKL